jgi:hypothetical protein
MKKNIKQKSLQAASCLIFLLVWWRNESFVAPLAGTEFSGGWLTGPLLNFHILGGLLLAPGASSDVLLSTNRCGNRYRSFSALSAALLLLCRSRRFPLGFQES